MSIPLSIKVGFVLLGLGTLVFLIGYCSSKWVDFGENRTSRDRETKKIFEYRREINFGLWRLCIHDKVTIEKKRRPELCFQFLSRDDTRDGYIELSGSLRAAQFFETVALLLVIPIVVLLVLSVFVDACKNRKVLPILAGVCAFVAAGSVFLGAIIFGSEYHDLAWSFALTVVGGVFFALTGAAIIAGVIFKK